MIDLSSQVKVYLKHCEYQRKLSEKTLRAYGIDLRQYVMSTLGYDNALERDAIADYIQQLHFKFKPKTVKRKVASLRAFLNFLEFERVIGENPMAKMRLGFREPIVLPKSLTFNAINKLLNQAYAVQKEAGTGFKKKAAVRNSAVLELLFATGLRVSELCSITSATINLQDGRINVLGKGARERIVYVSNPEVISALKQYYGLFENQILSTGWFFINKLGNRFSEQSVRTMIRAYADMAHLSEHITPHTIRHSFATLMLDEDVDIRYIQSILGHSSIATTQIYTHVSGSKVKSIMQKKHPRNKIHIE